MAPAAAVRPTAAQGPVLVLSGSQSPVSAEQVGAATSYAQVEIDAPAAALRCVELLRAGRHVLARTGAVRDVAAGRVLAEVLREVKLPRVGISGGDTSSQVVRALGIEALEYTAELAPGVALCRARGTRLDGMELMLKGGQMGAPDIFERLIAPH